MARLSNTSAYNQAVLGQFGAIHAHDAEQSVVPPDGFVFCAIQFLADTKFLHLRSERNDGLDFAQNHQGQVLTASAANDDFFIDQDTTADLTGSDMAVGDLVYHEDGKFIGTVKLIGRNKADDADDTSGFHLDRTPSPAVADDDILTIIKPNSNQGGGSSDIDNTVVFPKGVTIFGAWTAFALNDTDTDGGVIAYLAPADRKQEV